MYSLRFLLAAGTCYYGILEVFFLAGYPSQTQKELIDNNILNAYTLPIFGSAPYIGNVLGSSLVGVVTHWIDGYILSIISLVTSAVGWNFIIIGYSGWFIIVGTILVGLKNGIMLTYIFAYFAEICLESQWKILGGGLGLCVRGAVFITYSLGVFLSYRWLAIVGITTDLSFCILLLFLPPSPVKLVIQNKDEKAKSVLNSLHGDTITSDEELANIKHELNANKETSRGIFSELKQWKVLKPILIVSILHLFKEFGGHEAIVVFSSIILESQGMNPKVASLSYPIFLLLGSLSSICLVKYFSLKGILFVTTALQALSHLSMAMYFFTSIDILYCNSLPSEACEFIIYWAIANVILYAFAFSAGWGTILFTLYGILFHTQKEISIAFVSVVAALSDVIFPYIFYTLYVNLGEFWSFIFILNILFLALLFQYLFINDY